MNCKKLLPKHRFIQSSFPAPKRKFKAFIWNAVIIYIMFFICTRKFLWTKKGRCCSQVLQRRRLLLYLNSKINKEEKPKQNSWSSLLRVTYILICLLSHSIFLCLLSTMTGWGRGRGSTNNRTCCRASVVLPLPPSYKKNYITIWNSVFNFGIFNPRTLIF